MKELKELTENELIETSGGTIAAYMGRPGVGTGMIESGAVEIMASALRRSGGRGGSRNRARLTY